MQPNVCLTVVLDEADNFLVIRRSKRSTNAGRWEPPLGHREPGENPEDAALREVAEETGLSVQLLSGTTDKRSDDGGGLRLFLARANGTKPEVKTEPSEHDAHKWLTLDEMNALEDCHDSLKADISKLLKANSQTKEANMLTTMQSGMGLPFAPRFSGTYQPKLSGPPNPLASVKAPAVAKADAAGVQQALAKAGSMCLSATGEGPKRYKVNPEDAATGEKAFESLDRFKRAGLNDFQASFFSRMVNEGRDASQIKQAIAIAERKFGKKVAGELREGFNKLAVDPTSPAAIPQTAAKPSTADTVPKIPSGGFKPFGTIPEKFQPKSRLSPLPKSQMPPPLSPEELYGKNKPIGPYDPSNIRAAGGIRFLPDQLINKNLEKTYLDKLQQYYNPASEQWQQETYLPEDTWNKNLSRLGGAAAIPALAYAGSRIPGAGSFLAGTAGGLGATTYANQLAGENLKTQLSPYLNQANTALSGVGDLVTQLKDPKSELAQSYMGAMSDKLFENPRLAKLMAIADKFDSGSGGLDLAGLFSKNQNWLIPLLAAFAAGGVGGGALGGTGGALGGAIGLPLIYYLMQNPEALSQFTGGAPGAQKPQATPPATPPTAPQQRWPGPPHPYPAGA